MQLQYMQSSCSPPSLPIQNPTFGNIMRFLIYVSLKYRNYIKYGIQCSYHQARNIKALARGMVQSQEK